MTDRPESPGVYARRPGGQVVQVHAYQDGDYGLTDIAEVFGLGEAGLADDGRPALALTRKELRQLKVLADAYSFDYEEGLIELCLDLHRFALEADAEPIRFWADF
ncbi:MAG: hypothetical protein ACE5KF_07235 [Kiloniellaceae bacterium]